MRLYPTQKRAKFAVTRLATVSHSVSRRNGYPPPSRAFQFAIGSARPKMYDYITKELPELFQAESTAFPWYDNSKISITGHSMGGHGALTIGLKNPEKYQSISAFAPIVNPNDESCPWGVKAFNGYLAGGHGSDEAKSYDACELIKGGAKPQGDRPILVDQGTKDNFYCGDVNQLKTEHLVKVCQGAGVELQANMREGYDHSYYFISSFIDDHVKFHSKYLN